MMDGLELYAYSYAHVRFSAEIMQRIRYLEDRARAFAICSPNPYDYVRLKKPLIAEFLNELQAFLVATSEGPYDYTVFSTTLKPTDAASCFWLFASTDCRMAALRALKPLVGGKESYFNGGELRTVTALARFLKPDSWSALSWRVLACTGFHSISHLRDSWSPISKKLTMERFSDISFAEVLMAYSTLESLLNDNLPTLSQVTMGLYNLSLEIWPMDLPFDKTTSDP